MKWLPARLCKLVRSLIAVGIREFRHAHLGNISFALCQWECKLVMVLVSALVCCRHDIFLGVKNVVARELVSRIDLQRLKSASAGVRILVSASCWCQRWSDVDIAVCWGRKCCISFRKPIWRLVLRRLLSAFAGVSILMSEPRWCLSDVDILGVAVTCCSLCGKCACIYFLLVAMEKFGGVGSRLRILCQKAVVQKQTTELQKAMAQNSLYVFKKL